MNWVIIGPGNGLSPIRRQAITWRNACLLSTGLLGIYFSEIWIGILSFSFTKIQLKMSSVKMAAILSRGRWVEPSVGRGTTRGLPYSTRLAKTVSKIAHVSNYIQINISCNTRPWHKANVGLGYWFVIDIHAYNLNLLTNEMVLLFSMHDTTML